VFFSVVRVTQPNSAARYTIQFIIKVLTNYRSNGDCVNIEVTSNGSKLY
jgi:hypothetical protein